MRLSIFINKLTMLLAQNGDIEITRLYDGIDYEPRLRVNDKSDVYDPDSENGMKEITVPKRVQIH